MTVTISKETQEACIKGFESGNITVVAGTRIFGQRGELAVGKSIVGMKLDGKIYSVRRQILIWLNKHRRLIAENCVIGFKDGDKSNFNIDNLIEVEVENRVKFAGYGNLIRGGGKELFSHEEVRKIREDYLQSDAELIGDIAKRLDKSRSTIYHLLKGITYTDVPGAISDLDAIVERRAKVRRSVRTVKPKAERKVNDPKFSDEEVLKLRLRVARKEYSSIKALADELGMSHTALRAVLLGYSYKHVGSALQKLGKGNQPIIYRTRAVQPAEPETITEDAADSTTEKEYPVKHIRRVKIPDVRVIPTPNSISTPVARPRRKWRPPVIPPRMEEYEIPEGMREISYTEAHRRLLARYR